MNHELLQKRRIIFFGAGQMARTLISKYKVKIAYFVSNTTEKHDTLIGNIPVRSPEYLRDDPEDKYIVIATSKRYFKEIASQLVELGFEHGRDFDECVHLFPEEITNVRRISYLVNHRCNSRCKMCNIWQENRDGEMMPEELRTYLSSPYFNLVDSFLLTGGEPSLSIHLPEYAIAAAAALPNLKSFSINVNGLLPDRIYEMADKIRKDMNERGVDFFIAVSLDGIGTVHDEIRGVKGAFERAFSLLKRLKENGFDVQVSTTVMKDNVWNLDEYLSLLRGIGIEAMFKLVRKSATLNGGLANGEDDFTEDEFYQIRLFYRKLYSLSQNGYTPGFCHYYQMINEYLETGKRLAMCSFAEGLALHIKEDGGAYICANSVKELCLDGEGVCNLEELNCDNYQFTRHALCVDCISDCMALDSYELEKRRKRESFFSRFFTVEYFHSHRDTVINELPKGRRENIVLITGWYGTETVGDKAILGEIIHYYQEKCPDIRICVTSIYPFITERTVKELGVDAEVVSLFDWECLKLAAVVKEVCMGGGPLMEMEFLSIPLWLFSIAKAAGGKTRIFACGMGPFLTNNKIEAARELILLADSASFRDSASTTYARQLSKRGDIEKTCDPAKDYLQRKFGKAIGGRDVLACFLREPTCEYRSGMSIEEYAEFQRKFEHALANNLKRLAKRHRLKIHLYSMHNFCVGCDDRDFAFRFAREYLEPGFYWVDNSLSSIDSVVQAMQGASLCICMRFHSVLFADALGIEYGAVDYTRGGKIYGYLKDHDQLDRLIDMDAMIRSDRTLEGRFQ